MNCLMEIEKARETKLKLAKIEDGFYNIIGGQRSAAARKLSVINPATGKELATVPAIVAASLDDPVDAARTAFPGWHALPLAHRKEILSEVLTEIDRHAEELSVLLTAEQVRPLFQARWEIDLVSKVYGPAFMQMDIRLYQDLECIMPHDESSSVGGAYAKLRRGNPTSMEFTGHDGVNRASIHGTAAPFRGCIGGLSAGPHDRWAPPYEPSL